MTLSELFINVHVKVKVDFNLRLNIYQVIHAVFKINKKSEILYESERTVWIKKLIIDVVVVCCLAGRATGVITV